MSDTKAIRISSVKYLEEFSLRLRWVNGTVTSVDLREPVQRLKGLKALRDKSVFAAAKKGDGGHSVVWPGDLDMGADRLWERRWNNRAVKMRWSSFVGVGVSD
jgi:hypothetical protein